MKKECYQLSFNHASCVHNTLINRFFGTEYCSNTLTFFWFRANFQFVRPWYIRVSVCHNLHFKKYNMNNMKLQCNQFSILPVQKIHLLARGPHCHLNKNNRKITLMILINKIKNIAYRLAFVPISSCPLWIVPGTGRRHPSARFSSQNPSVPPWCPIPNL